MRVYMLFLVEMEHPFSLLSFRLSCYLLQRARRGGGGRWGVEETFEYLWG